MVSAFGVSCMVWGKYVMFGYLDPLGPTEVEDIQQPRQRLVSLLRLRGADAVDDILHDLLYQSPGNHGRIVQTYLFIHICIYICIYIEIYRETHTRGYGPTWEFPMVTGP